MICVIIAPPEAYAVLKDAKVSPHADVALLAAPCSISAAAVQAAMKASREIVLWTPACLSIGGVLAVLVTLYAIFTACDDGRRRRDRSSPHARLGHDDPAAAITCVRLAPRCPNVHLLWAARAVAAVDLVFIFGVCLVGCGNASRLMRAKRRRRQPSCRL